MNLITPDKLMIDFLIDNCHDNDDEEWDDDNDYLIYSVILCTMPSAHNKVYLEYCDVIIYLLSVLLGYTFRNPNNIPYFLLFQFQI